MIMHWGPADNYPPPRRGQNPKTYRSKAGGRDVKPSKSKGGGGKPPKKGGGLCIQVAPFAAWPALAALANAVGQSFM